MKKIIMLLVIWILSLECITGCGKDKTEPNENFEDIVVNAGRTAQDKEFYFINYSGFYELDKNSLELLPACRDATCNHTGPKCTFNSEVSCVRNYNDLILASIDNEIYEFNTDTYEMSEYYKVSLPNCRSVIGFYIFDNKIIYSAYNTDGEGFLIAEDMNTGSIEELLDRKTDICDVSDDGIMYVYTSEFEPYAIDLESLEKVKLSDEIVRDVECVDDKLYYIQVKNNTKYLCTANRDGSGVKVLIEDVSDYKIYGNRIYYSNDRDKNILEGSKLYSSDLEGEDRKILIEDKENIMGIYILPDIGRVLTFNFMEQEQYEEYILINYDGSDLYSGEAQKFWQ